MIRTWKKFTVVVTTSMTLVAGVAFGHHGWSSYNEKNTLNVTGTIEKSSYGNPHGTLDLKAGSADGKVWKVVLAPPSRMDNRGLSSSMLEKGTSVTIVGYPHTEKGDEMRAERITVGDKTVELR